MTINHIKDMLLKPADLTEEDIFSTLSSIATRQIDYADIYFQLNSQESLILEDSIIKEGSFNIDCGVGVRAIVGEKTGFAYSNQINLDGLKSNAFAARSIAQKGGNGKVQSLKRNENQDYYFALNPLNTWGNKQKIEFLKQLDYYIRSKESLIEEVSISLNAMYDQILVFATDETYAGDIRPLVRLSISVLVKKGNRRERGTSGGGGRLGYDFFLDKNIGYKTAYRFADEAIHQALINLEAISAPAGLMPVVLGSGWPGVLLHEAIGHGLEGDFNRKGSSVFSGKIGQQVTSNLCTIVDDATLKGRRGSLNIDDEGTSGQYSVLIENGILKNYMQDKHNAHLMGMSSTGNGRRESYAHLPIPRMTNTYMLPGKHTPEEIISTVHKGLYAPNFSGGQVDITSGKFVFSTSEAYLIEEGKITSPVKDASLIGSGIEVMQQVSMIGNDLNIDCGVGVCGKDGQNVPVGVGQPTLKLDFLTVGGTD
ncbi:Zn-dependent protease [Candidatus Photodesmus katoptron]|uniref:Zn-dependent protease n=1 Tax=Candidatus Photodesmus katoptron Akat1 TaxID=1236703 RepID=S3E0N7_9GAMM|nr:metalloprotease TldD [Candidatus Photodesmus katoptron]EPE37731.1 Zn-dependent protease [Candidatus Photodesmus katoptron Akat1]KEY90547.1 Zn-dependent protease [Candidatus Photodesmus katoptron]